MFAGQFRLSQRLDLRRTLKQIRVRPRNGFRSKLSSTIGAKCLVRGLRLGPRCRLMDCRVPSGPSRHLDDALKRLFTKLSLQFAWWRG